MLSVQHCQLGVFFVFSYPTLCLQPAQPDELSCLGHLDRTIRITADLHHDPSAHPPTGTGIKSFQSATTTWFFHSPKPLSHRYLCAVTQQRAWHRVPAASGMFHPLQLRLLTCSPLLPATGIVAAVPKYRWSKCLKQARELCSPV